MDTRDETILLSIYPVIWVAATALATMQQVASYSLRKYQYIAHYNNYSYCDS